MKSELSKDGNTILIAGLLLISVSVVVLGIVKIAGFYMTSAKAQSVAEIAAARSSSDDNSDLKEALENSKLVADGLKKKNLFAPPEPKVHPVKEVQGIIGDEVLINGKAYKVGAMIGDAKVVAIEPTKAIIEWNGTRKGFAPIAASTGEGVSLSSPQAVQQPETEVLEVKNESDSKAVVEESVSAPREEDPFSWIGVELSSDLREKFLERWNHLTDEQKANAKAEWGKMSAEQKKQAIEMWKQM